MAIGLRLSASGKLWLLLSFVLALGAGVGWLVPAGSWDWQPVHATAQPWRWWTAAFVHWSPLHLGANLVGLCLVALLGRLAAVPAVIGLAWLASWPLTHLALLARPELAHFGGLSGVLHGGVAVAASWLVVTQGDRRRRIGWALLAGLLAKVVLETPWGAVLQNPAAWDIAVAPLAHATGAISGLGCALVALARGPGRRA